MLLLYLIGLLRYRLGYILHTRGLLVWKQMNLPPNWNLFREHRGHTLLGLFSLNPWWRYLRHISSKALRDWTLLRNSWNFNGRILISSRYLILRLCFDSLSRLRILNRLDISHYFWKLSCFTSIFGHSHGALSYHGRWRVIPHCFLFISDFFLLSLNLLTFGYQLPPLCLLPLLHIPHQLGESLSFLL
jgi:hypothetical protein